MGTKIDRKLMKIFGSAAGLNQRAKIGSLAAGVPEFTTDIEEMQSNGNYLGGWFASILGGNSPAIQDMNSLHNLITYQLSYLMQSGVAEWNDETEYFIGSIVMSSGLLYSSLVDNNLNYAVTDVSKWAPKNPMSAVGDLIIGGALGKETRLAAGAEGQVLSMVSGSPAWGQGIPSGTILEYAGANVPSGYLALGQNVLRALYPDLFATIGVAFGIGDGSTTFSLPPVGYFARQYGSIALDVDAALRTAALAGTHTISGGSTISGNPNVTVDSTVNLAAGMTVTGAGIPAGAVVRAVTGPTTFTMGDAANSTNVNATSTTSAQTFTFSKSATGNYLGSIQSDTFGSHTHTQNSHFHAVNGLKGVGTNPGQADGVTTGGVNFLGNTAAATATNQNSGGSETRPKNMYINKMIKY